MSQLLASASNFLAWSAQNASSLAKALRSDALMTPMLKAPRVFAGTNLSSTDFVVRSTTENVPADCICSNVSESMAETAMVWVEPSFRWILSTSCPA